MYLTVQFSINQSSPGGGVSIFILTPQWFSLT